MLYWFCFWIFFFCNIFKFFFRIIYNRKTYFLNNNLQNNNNNNNNNKNNKQTKTNKTFYHPLYPSLWLLKTIFFCLLLHLNSTLPLPLHSSRPKGQIKSGKMSKVLVFKTFSTYCHFLLYIVCFFSLFIKFFSSMFLTFMISLIKDF